MKNKFRFIGIIALVAVIGFGMAGCDDGSGGGNNDPKTIVITGIPAEITNINDFGLLRRGSGMLSAAGSGEVSSGSVTIALIGGSVWNPEPWTGNGNFIIEFSTPGPRYWYYTGGRTFAELGATGSFTYDPIPEYNIRSATSTIPWNQFQEWIRP